MATAEEILAQMTAVAETEAVCMIDPETRTISIPADFKLLGVESDEKAERIKFRCPRVVGDNLDLTKFGIRINYRNASGEKDGYAVDDVKIDGEDIIFSWQLDRKVTKYKGDVNFIVCAVKGAENEWNTTLATAKVLEGLETEISGNEEDKTLLEQLIAITNQKLTEMSLALTEAKKQTEKTEQATKNAETATKNAQDAAQAVFEQQYILTSETRFIGEAAEEPSGEGAAIIKNLPGGIKQDKTNGYQLFDASKFPKKTAGEATVENNGDGSFTISGNGVMSANNSHFYALKDYYSKLKVGKMYGKVSEETYPFVQLGVYDTAGTPSKQITLTKNVNYIEITQDDIDKLNTDEKELRVYILGFKGRTIIPGTFKTMIYQDGDGTWEPFSGAEPSPNPDYPQAIKCIGGNGWFDGECKKGFYLDEQTQPVFVANPDYRCFANPIPCKENDLIEFKISNAQQYMYLFALDQNNNRLKTFLNDTTGNKLVATMPSGTKYCTGYYGGTNPAIKESVITVLKNGKYAIKVETRGKNLFNKDTKDKARGSADSVVNGDTITVTVTGSSNSPVVFFKLGEIEEYKGKTLYFKCEAIEKSKPTMKSKLSIRATKNNSVSVKTLKEIETPRIWGMATVPEDVGEADSLTLCLYADTGANPAKGAYTKFTEVIVAESQVESYEPYKESITYIPLDSPLYEGDRIYLEDGELWEYRENARVVFDGSEDGRWRAQTPDHTKILNTWIDIETAKKSENDKVSITRTGVAGAVNDSVKNIHRINDAENALLLDVDKDVFQTLQEFIDFLKSNPIEFVYKLKTPTIKKLGSAEAFNIRTFSERTYIEVAGSEELGTENTFIVPRNQSGGLMTDAFATAKRNAIQVAEQANLASRISALEQLAVKESV